MLDEEGSLLSLQHREVFLMTGVSAYGVLARLQTPTIVFTQLLHNMTQGSRYVLWMGVGRSRGVLKRRAKESPTAFVLPCVQQANSGINGQPECAERYNTIFSILKMEGDSDKCVSIGHSQKHQFFMILVV